MSKIGLIIKREYITRVRKKSFIIMTLLGPLLMASIYVVPILLYKFASDSKRILVVDDTHSLSKALKNNKSVQFQVLDSNMDQAKNLLKTKDSEGLLHIPANIADNPKGVTFYSEQQASLDMLDYVEEQLGQAIEDQRLMESGIKRSFLDSVKTDIDIQTFKVTDTGEESSNSGLVTTIGIVFGILIYMFIFIFGAQVMRGVIEEKVNRILEVIISSVKPFELMMGKIVGIALVGLTQFLLWIVLTTAISGFLGNNFASKIQSKASTEQLDQHKVSQSENAIAQNGGLLESIKALNAPMLIGAFLFYFLGGYLLYGALFAAIGAAVDSEADTQQFMLPITIPLILSFVVAQFVIMNPSGPVAFWFSIIPFTSPVVMMVRIPFGVPVFDLVLSMSLLVLGFIGTTALAAKIYRIGILMYGKKPSYKEIGKWLFYKG